MEKINQSANCLDMPIDVPGLSNELRDEIERRVSEFEKNHEQQVLEGGSGWVPRIKRRDYIIAGIVNLAILLYWVSAIS